MILISSLTLHTPPNPEGLGNIFQGRQVGLQYITETGRLSWSS